MKSMLRTVVYTLSTGDTPGFMDCSNDERTERTGLFHRWGDEIIHEGNRPFQRTYGIVEDIETGKIELVIPDQIKFEH